MDEQYLTIQEVADRFRVSLRTVYGWNQAGNGPQYRRIVGHCRYPLSAVVAWEQSSPLLNDPAQIGASA